MVNRSTIISSELANITDAQLQRRLKEEFNFACGPITDTTKSIYIKKLQELIDKSTASPATTSTGRSTPVKTPSTPVSTPKATRKRRATIAPASIEPVVEPVAKPETPKVTSKW